MAETGRIRVGVIGCGDIAGAHLDAYAADGRATVVAVADSVRSAAERRADEFGVGGVYASYRQMLEAENLDAVSVCTPPPSHREITERAAIRGLHVLCEKPLAMCVADGESMVESTRSSGVILMTAFCQRFFGHVIEARQSIRAGALGAVHQFRFRRGEETNYERSWIGDPARGGGLFWESGAHSVDMFRHLVGEIAAVYATGSNTSQEMSGADTITMLLEGERGEIGLVEQSWSSPESENRIEIHGEHGAIVIDHNSGRTRISDRNGTRWLETDEKRSDRFRREIAHFVDCVEGKAAPSVTGEDGVEAMRVIEAAVRSARDRTREPVRR